MNNDIKMQRIDYLIISAIAVISFAVIYPFSIREFDVHHTGLMFQMAHDVANGRKMFSEVFNQYGVLPVLIQACFIKLLGDRVYSIILSAVIAYAITFCLNYLCFFKLIGRLLSVFSTMVLLALGPFYFIYWTFLPWSSVYALMFFMFTMLFFEHYIYYMDTKYMYFSAISAFCVFLSRQPVGIVTILSFGVIAISFRIVNYNQIKKREWVKWCAILVALLIAYIGIVCVCCGKTGIRDYYLQMFVWPMLWSDSVGGITTLFGHLLPITEFSLSWTIVPVACLVMYFILMVVLVNNKQKQYSINSIVILSFSVFAVASWAQYFPITCIRHLFWSIFPMMSVFLWGLLRTASFIIEKHGKRLRVSVLRYRMLAVLLSVLVICILWTGEMFLRFKGGILKMINGYHTIENDAGYGYLDKLKISDEERIYYLDLHSVVKKLEYETKKPVLNMTRDAYYSTFSDTNDEPLFLFGGMAAVIYDDYMNDVRNYIDNQHPILLKNSTNQEDYMENYHLYTTINNMNIYVYDE